MARRRGGWQGGQPAGVLRGRERLQRPCPDSRREWVGHLVCPMRGLRRVPVLLSGRGRTACRDTLYVREREFDFMIEL
jgi:hypothetical protein